MAAEKCEIPNCPCPAARPLRVETHSYTDMWDTIWRPHLCSYHAKIVIRRLRTLGFERTKFWRALLDPLADRDHLSVWVDVKQFELLRDYASYLEELGLADDCADSRMPFMHYNGKPMFGSDRRITP